MSPTKTVSILFILFLSAGCNVLVNKFAYYPDTVNIVPAEKLPDNVQELFIETEDHVKIQCYFIPSNVSNRILIYFHGNAGNISHRLADLIKLNEFGINVLGVSYRGYGKSEGSPSEKGLYFDGKAALEYATEQLGFSMSHVILFGRSIGTTVAVNTAQNKNISGLILVSPLTSGKAQAKASGFGVLSSFAGDALNNIEKISNVKCPLLVIHGTNDRVIPFEMGVELYNKAESKKEFVTIGGANHNNLSNLYKHMYWPPINHFVSALR